MSSGAFQEISIFQTQRFNPFPRSPGRCRPGNKPPSPPFNLPSLRVCPCNWPKEFFCCLLSSSFVIIRHLVFLPPPRFPALAVLPILPQRRIGDISVFSCRHRWCLLPIPTRARLARRALPPSPRRARGLSLRSHLSPQRPRPCLPLSTRVPV